MNVLNSVPAKTCALLATSWVSSARTASSSSRQLRDHVADARALAQVAIQKDRFTEVFLDRAEDLLARRAIGTDDERIVAVHARGKIGDDLLAADRGGARDLLSR